MDWAQKLKQKSKNLGVVALLAIGPMVPCRLTIWIRGLSFFFFCEPRPKRTVGLHYQWQRRVLARENTKCLAARSLSLTPPYIPEGPSHFRRNPKPPPSAFIRLPLLHSLGNPGPCHSQSHPSSRPRPIIFPSPSLTHFELELPSPSLTHSLSSWVQPSDCHFLLQTLKFLKPLRAFFHLTVQILPRFFLPSFRVFFVVELSLFCLSMVDLVVWSTFAFFSCYSIIVLMYALFALICQIGVYSSEFSIRFTCWG